MQDTPQIRAKKAARWDELVAQGKSPEDAVATVEREFSSPGAMAPAESSSYTGRTPEQAKGEQLKFIGGVPVSSVVGMGLGMGTGAMTAKALAAKLGPKILGRIATGAISGVAGGATTRGVQAEGGVPERLKAAFSPIPVATDVALGGGLGAVLGQSRAIDKKAAERLTGVIPRMTRQGVPKDVGALAGVTPEAPKQVVQGMKAAIGTADEARFSPLWKSFPDAISDPAVVDQWNAIRRNIPGAVQDMLAEKDIARESTLELLQKIGDDELPTLQGVQRLKEVLDEAIKTGKAGAANSSVAARGLRSLKIARKQLKQLTFSSVPGGPEYQAALEASAADRAVPAAVKQGVEAISAPAPGNELRATTGADVQDLVSKFSAAPSGATVGSPLEGYRKGVVGGLSTTPNPLERLKNPATSEKVGTALGVSGSQLDEATSPWKRAMEVGKRLEKTGDLGISGQFGAAQAAGGSIPGARLLAGATGIHSLERKLAIQEAEKLRSLFETLGKNQNLDDYRQILRLLAEARSKKALLSGVAGGTATSGTATALRYGNRNDR